MIGFADTAWEIFSLAGVFALGLVLLSRLCLWMGVPGRHGLSLYLWHSVFCALYIWYSMNNPSDSVKYFMDSLNWDTGPMFGGRSVTFFNSILTQMLGLSYAGCFFVFNIFGTIGLIAFSAALRDALCRKSLLVRRLGALIPFLPGFSFWSTAIGKDSIAFLGVGLLCWAAAQPYRRFPAIAIGFIAMLVVRPHMAGFLVVALAVAFSLVNQGSLKLKLIVNALVLPTSVAVVVLSIGYVGLDASEDVAEYVAQRQSYNSEGGSSVDISNASVPARMFMYVFRPMLFDAGGAFGFVVSIENLLLFGIFLSSLLGLIVRGTSLTKFQRVFFTIYVAVSWLALANTTANLGIAIRQKSMFTPMLLLLMFSYLPNRRLASPVAFHPCPTLSKTS